MQHFRNLLQARRVDRDEAGASAVEYGLLVAGIAALIVAVVFLFGGMIKRHVHRHLRHHRRQGSRIGWQRGLAPPP